MSYVLIAIVTIGAIVSWWLIRECRKIEAEENERLMRGRADDHIHK